MTATSCWVLAGGSAGARELRRPRGGNRRVSAATHRSPARADRGVTAPLRAGHRPRPARHGVRGAAATLPQRGRPPDWRGIPALPGYHYRPSDGAIRDPSRNVLPTFSVDAQLCVSVRRGVRRYPYRVAALVAASGLKTPQPRRCYVCGRGLRYSIVHKNGDWRDPSQDNLAYAMNPIGWRAHERGCLERLMVERSRPRRDAGEHPNAGACGRGRVQHGWLWSLADYLAA